jgi:LmbE family N-acetylglucosaminyl deacetylase
MFRKIIIIVSILLIIILLLPAILFLVAGRVMAYLSAPVDLERAKERGEALAAAKNRRIVVVVAHPDDVDWYVGGTLARLHQNGNKITVVLGTSGEKGSRRVADLGKVREKEQEQAGHILGYDDIIFLRFPDRGLTPDNKFEAELRKIFTEFKPNVIFTFDIEKEGYVYHHSDHRAAGKAALEVVKDFPGVEKIYLFHTRAPNVIIDIGKVVKLKTKALEAHGSMGSNTISRIFRFLPFLRRSANRSRYNLDPGLEEKTGIKYAELIREEK